ncbi:MAG: septal ring lytic transglycosylase RlpA family lipoprotein, partial [Sphingobium sp.]
MAAAAGLTGDNPIRAETAPIAVDGPVKLGRPFKVGSLTYIPADEPAYEDVGYASWYGDEMAGNRTANGERFNPSGIS